MNNETMKEKIDSAYKALDCVTTAGADNHARILGVMQILLEIAKEIESGNILCCQNETQNNTDD